MMNDSGTSAEQTPVQNVMNTLTKYQRLYQQQLDRWTPHVLQRWLALAGLVAVFFLRIVFAQGVSAVSFAYISPESELFAIAVVHWSVRIAFGATHNLLTCLLGSRFVQFAVSTELASFQSGIIHIVLDALAIYLLNLLLAFLQPKFDPSLEEDLLADEIEEGGDVPSPLPSQRDDEFRPFVRRLPEWQFWYVNPCSAQRTGTWP